MPERLPQLLIFAKDPASERVKTRLAAGIGADEARAFYQVSLGHLLEEFAGCEDLVEPVLVLTPPETAVRAAEGLGWSHTLRTQVPGDLGERLAHAFQEVDGPCMVVGTDMPELARRHVAAAAAALGPGKVVLGSCPDGGYYLLGSHRFHPELFQDMPWSTEDLAEATRARVRQMHLELVELEPVADIDYQEDLEALGRRLRGEGPLGRWLQGLWRRLDPLDDF